MSRFIITTFLVIFLQNRYLKLLQRSFRKSEKVLRFLSGMEVCRATDLCHQWKSRTHCFLVRVRPWLHEKSSHKCIWSDIKTFFRAWGMPQVAVWLRSWRVCCKEISSEYFWQSYRDSACTHKCMTQTIIYTRDHRTVEQNTTHRRILSYPCCG